MNHRPNASKANLIEKVIKIKRCAAVVKGGRRFSFAGMVVVGDGKGKVGWGYGKANEVPPSVEKAVKDGIAQHGRRAARRQARSPHAVEGPLRRRRRGAAAGRPGTGVIAGAAVRAVCEAAGIHDILTKSFGSNNPINRGQGHVRRTEATCAPSKTSSACEESSLT